MFFVFPRNLDHDEAVSLRCRKVGHLLSTILYQRSRLRYSFVQGCVGIELWRQRVSRKVFVTLNHMGITQGIQASKSKVEEISKSHDKQLWEWKRTTEVSFLFPSALSLSGILKAMISNFLTSLASMSRVLLTVFSQLLRLNFLFKKI